MSCTRHGHGWCWELASIWPLWPRYRQARGERWSQSVGAFEPNLGSRWTSANFHSQEIIEVKSELASTLVLWQNNHICKCPASVNLLLLMSKGFHVFRKVKYWLNYDLLEPSLMTAGALAGDKKGCWAFLLKLDSSRYKRSDWINWLWKEVQGLFRVSREMSCCARAFFYAASTDKPATLHKCLSVSHMGWPYTL